MVIVNVIARPIQRRASVTDTVAVQLCHERAGIFEDPYTQAGLDQHWSQLLHTTGTLHSSTTRSSLGCGTTMQVDIAASCSRRVDQPWSSARLSDVAFRLPVDIA